MDPRVRELILNDNRPAVVPSPPTFEFYPTRPIEVRALKFGDSMYLDNSEQFQCPVCGEDYLHQQQPVVQYEGSRLGVEGIGDRFLFNYGGVLIPYLCECYSHLFFVAVADHKGLAFLTTVRNIEPLSPGDVEEAVPLIMENLKTEHDSTAVEHRNRENPVSQVFAILTEYYGRSQLKAVERNIVTSVTSHPHWKALRKVKRAAKASIPPVQKPVAPPPLY